MAAAVIGGESSLMQRCKPYVAMVSLQFGYAGMNVITKVSLNHGMSHYVLVVYRHAFATLSIAPFALALERKVRPRMTPWVFLQIFVLALLGWVASLAAAAQGLSLSLSLCSELALAWKRLCFLLQALLLVYAVETTDDHACARVV